MTSLLTFIIIKTLLKLQGIDLLLSITKENYSQDSTKLEYFCSIYPEIIPSVLNYGIRLIKENKTIKQYIADEILKIVENFPNESIIQKIFEDLDPSCIDEVSDSLLPVHAAIIAQALQGVPEFKEKAEEILSRDIDDSFLFIPESCIHLIHKRDPDITNQIVEHNWPNLSDMPTYIAPLFLGADSMVNIKYSYPIIKENVLSNLIDNDRLIIEGYLEKSEELDIKYPARILAYYLNKGEKCPIDIPSNCQIDIPELRFKSPEAFQTFLTYRPISEIEISDEWNDRSSHVHFLFMYIVTQGPISNRIIQRLVYLNDYNPEVVQTIFTLIDPQELLYHFAFIESGWSHLPISYLNNVIPSSKIWTIAPHIATMIYEYRWRDGDLNSPVEVLDKAIEYEVLNEVLLNDNIKFILEVAALAFQREIINFEMWYKQSKRRGLKGAVLDFIQQKIDGGVPKIKNKILEKMKLAIETSSQVGSKYQTKFPQEIELEANSMFTQLFQGRISPKEFSELIHNSPNQLKSCLINALLNEINHISKYDESPMIIIARLLGILINKNYIENQANLGIALRGILRAYSNPSNTMLNKFGSTAMNEFSDRMNEFAQFRKHIISSPQVDFMKPLSTEELNSGGQWWEDPKTFDSLEQTYIGGAKLTSLPVETLTDNASVTNIPDESTVDQVLFIFNSVSEENVIEKASDLSKCVNEEFYPWLARYFVIKRVTIESAYHNVYFILLDVISKPVLTLNVKKELYKNSITLLKSDKINTLSERTLLKNIGNFLGMLTLKLNLPIRKRDLDLIKILESNHSATVPFVCKIIVYSENSIISPSNPWIQKIISILETIKNHPETKLNVQFEIDMLFKRLGYVSFEEKVLREPEFNVPLELDEDLRKKIIDKISEIVMGVITPIVTRSVSISVNTTAELVTKDFALEPSASKMREASGKMAISLGSMLAITASVEPMKVSLLESLTNLFINNGYDFSSSEKIINSIIHNNIVSINEIIKKAVEVQAKQEMEEILSADFELREHGILPDIPKPPLPDFLLQPPIKAYSLFQDLTRPDEFTILINGWINSIDQEIFRLRDLFTHTGTINHETSLNNLVHQLPTLIRDTDYLRQVIPNVIDKVRSIFSQAIEIGEAVKQQGDSYQHYEGILAIMDMCITTYIRSLVAVNNDQNVPEFIEWVTREIIEIPFNVTFAFLFFREGLIKTEMLDKPLAKAILHEKNHKAFEFAIIIVKQLVDSQDSKSIEGIPQILNALDMILLNYRNSPEHQEFVDLIQESKSLRSQPSLFISYLEKELNESELEEIRNNINNGIIPELIRFACENIDGVPDNISNIITEKYDGRSVNLGPSQAVIDLMKKIIDLDSNPLEILTNWGKSLSEIASTRFQVPLMTLFTLFDYSYTNFPYSIKTKIAKIYSEIIAKLPITCAFLHMYLLGRPFFISTLEDESLWEIFYTSLSEALIFNLRLSSFPMNKPIRKLYKAMLRILFVIMHDFPGFLCEYSPSIINHIPIHYIQMRNLITSAYPPDMILPDPFSPELKIDLLPSISIPPKISGPWLKPIEAAIPILANFLEQPEPSISVLNNIMSYIVDGASLNSFVLYICQYATSKPQNQRAPLEIFSYLISNLDPHGIYLFINAVSSQLRYPNSHTHYMSCVLLFLFSESQDDSLREIILRVLLERLIVFRPHPWGCLVTLIELSRNPKYRDSTLRLVSTAPEIEQLLRRLK